MTRLYSVVHLAISCDGMFELQFSMSDDLNKLLLITGSCCNGFVTKHHPCRKSKGYASETLIEERQSRTLLSLSELTAAREILKVAGFAHSSIDYYAIVNLVNTSLVAEHRLTEEKGQTYDCRTQPSDSDLRSCNNA